MKILREDIWKRRGVSLLWENDALAQLSRPQDVVSIRQLFAMVGCWPDGELPSNGGQSLVVAGLEGCLDFLEPGAVEDWLESDFRHVILEFQFTYGLEAALVFWLPGGKIRVQMNPASEVYSWRCAAPHSNHDLELGRILWGGAESDVCRIIDPRSITADVDGPAWIGLNHPRLS